MPDVENQPSKKLDPRALIEDGYLHEINRLVLHPLGLALEVKMALAPACRVTVPVGAIDELQRLLGDILEHGRGGMSPENATALRDAIQRGEWFNGGDAMLGSVWDCRDDPEGIHYGEDLLNGAKARAVCDLMLERRGSRIQALGYVVQPIPDARVLTTNYTSPEKTVRQGEFEFEQ